MKAIEAVGVSKVFEDGFTALDNIHLAAKPGEFLTLLGPSGCGKTTLLKTFAGFYPPTTGQIILGGQDVTAEPPEKRDTAMCFQSYALFPHLSVAENIEFGPRQNGVAKTERLKRLNDLLRQVDLEANKDKLPNKLSGGQQQRVALARALALQPSIVLFDEPLSNLDAKLREQVRREIRALQAQLGFTAIYVTHDQAEALAMSDRIVVMSKGRIDQVGAPHEVYERPSSVFVADFIGAANIVAFDRYDGQSINTALGMLRSADAPDNTNTHLCWRPEDARLANGNDTNAIAGTVNDLAYQGAYTEIYVRTGDAPMQRLHLPRRDYKVGDEIRYVLPPEKIRFVSSTAS